jgi:hypothetical protein
MCKMSRRARRRHRSPRGDSVELDALPPGEFRAMVRAVIEQPLVRAFSILIESERGSSFLF